LTLSSGTTIFHPPTNGSGWNGIAPSTPSPCAPSKIIFQYRPRVFSTAAAFIILPAHRRKGNGRALARLAIATLKAAGCHKVLADVLWHRDDSLAFWKLIDFEPVFIVTELTL